MTVAIYTSQVSDGSMKPASNDEATVMRNRTKFLQTHTIDPDATTLLHLTYGGDNYTRYLSLDDGMKGNGITRDSSIEVDALVVTKPGHALFLPLADCIGAVINDETSGVLMISHLGRHNLEQNGGTKSVDYLVKNHGVHPENLTVWLSPAAGKDNYPLFSFDNRSMHDVATEQLTAAGVPAERISISSVDTTTDLDYFSHSQFLAGNRETDGRFAVVALMTS